jgi:hypothetical protein
MAGAVRREDHRHAPTFEGRRPLGVAELPHVLRHAIEQRPAAFGMFPLATAEEHDQLDLGAVPEELDGAIALPPVVVVADLRPQLYLLERDVHLVTAARSRAPFLLEAPLPVVHDAADGRLCGRRDLDEIQVAGVRVRPRLVGGHDAELLPCFVDQAHLACTDLLVDPCGHPGSAGVRRRTAARSSHRTAADSAVFSN